MLETPNIFRGNLSDQIYLSIYYYLGLGLDLKCMPLRYMPN